MFSVAETLNLDVKVTACNVKVTMTNQNRVVQVDCTLELTGMPNNHAPSTGNLSYTLTFLEESCYIIWTETPTYNPV
jgi:hypothetical protein